MLYFPDLTGDDDASGGEDDASGGEDDPSVGEDEADHDDGDADDNASDEGHTGMLAPEGALPAHVDEAGCESDASNGMSGMEELDSDVELELDELDGDSSALLQPAVVEGELPAAEEVVSEVGKETNQHMSKQKAYHLSPEWIQLQTLEKGQNLKLAELPQIIGCGLGRHPAKSFWSARYPLVPAKSASWGPGTGKSPLECLIKCLRYVIEHHIKAFPHEDGWKNQLKNLEELSKS